MDAFTRTVWRGLKNYWINSSSATITVTNNAIPAGRRWFCIELALQVSADAPVSVWSGSTQLTGPVELIASGSLYRWTNHGLPVFCSATDGDELVLHNDDTVTIVGWALLAEVPD